MAALDSFFNRFITRLLFAWNKDLRDRLVGDELVVISGEMISDASSDIDSSSSSDSDIDCSDIDSDDVDNGLSQAVLQVGDWIWKRLPVFITSGEKLL